MVKHRSRQKLAALILEYSRLGALAHDLEITLAKIDAIGAVSSNREWLNSTPLADHYNTLMQSLFDSAVILFVGSTDPRQGVPQGLDLAPFLTDRQRRKLADLHELRSKSIAHRVGTGPKQRSVYHTDGMTLDDGNGLKRFGRRSAWKEDLINSINELAGVALAEVRKLDVICARELDEEFQAEGMRDQSLTEDIAKFTYDSSADTGSRARLHLHGVKEWVEAADTYHPE
jgi:hypothetical protein